MTRNYRVEWVAYIDAEGPLDAAMKANDANTDLGNYARWVYDVSAADEDRSKAIHVDLNLPFNCPAIQALLRAQEQS